MNFEMVKQDPAIRVYIQGADDSLAAQSFTEHSFPHALLVASRAGSILEELGFDSETAELGRIAGYLHDIGNLVNRVDHSQSGAVMAFRLLDHLGFSAEKIASVTTAIGNHDEGTGIPVSATAAALILADKSDVRRSRVRNVEKEKFDIHDRVNYSVTESRLFVEKEKKRITLSLTLSSEYGSVMEYFEIFMERMLLCRRAAEGLGTSFSLIINGQKMI